MSFLGGLAGGLASRAKDKDDDKKSPKKKPDFKGSPLGKLASKIKGAMSSKKQSVPSYKRGGKVKKTGPAKLHKGEKVIPKRSGKKR
jgi:hypothetical protein